MSSHVAPALGRCQCQLATAPHSRLPTGCSATQCLPQPTRIPLQRSSSTEQSSSPTPLSARKSYLEGMRPDVDSAAQAGFCGNSADVAPIGFVYVMFFVQDTQFSLGVQCAVYRALNHPDDAPLSERVLAVCKDMNTLLMAFVNDGIVTQAPAHPAAPPEMGQMVRRRKTWRFAREEGRWRSVALETRLPAMSLWTYFRQW